MKRFSKEIYIGKVSILITNFLSLGFSIKKPYKNGLHINLGSCQIAIGERL